MSDFPTLTQVQIIQSLGEALAWVEKELSWGVNLQDLAHLTGRVGELYAAMITRGQMALLTNQSGYDVVSATNERVSVKTITTSISVSFNRNTYHLVDRVMILRLVNDPDRGLALEELLDCSAGEAVGMMREVGTKLTYTVRSQRPKRHLGEMRVVDRAMFEGWELRKYENGAIRADCDGVDIDIVKNLLRHIAPKVGVDVLNGTGGVKNTQQLGSDIIRAINANSSPADP
jgi:hypothetical protein